MTLPHAYLNQLLRHRYDFFVEKVLASVSPGVTFLPNWHLSLIGEYLAACARGEITRLIINMPPRMLKSVTVSVAWPAWLLGHNPAQRIMVASYAQSLSTKHSLDTRLVMQSAWYGQLFPETRISPDQNEKEKFVTTKRGHRIAVSVGGAATGEGGNILIIDDPINPLQAMQGSARAQVNGWFDHTFSSRLDDKKRGAIVLVMQRLHAEDLSGYLMAKGGWEQLVLPAIAPQDAMYEKGRVHHHRKAGDALHEAREDAGAIARAARELGSAHFAAQYQQQPVTEESSMLSLSWFKRFDLEPYARTILGHSD